MNGIGEETRVRTGVKQTAKGSIQMDITTEAPTAEKALDLLGQAIDGLTAEVEKRGLSIVHE